MNAGIAFFVWLLSVFAVKKWLENKEAHREIADREEILRQIADNINGGVLTLVNDAGFCIRYANDGFLKLIGYTREELENAPSESINETAGAMSAGVPIRRIGTLAQ